MFFWQNKMSRYVLHAVDLMLVIVSFTIAYTVRIYFLAPFSPLSPLPNYYMVLILFLFFTNFALTFFRYADPVVFGSRFRELVRAAVIVLISTSLLILAMYTMHMVHVSRLMLGICSVTLFLLLYCRRWIVSNYIATSKVEGKNEVRILVIGSRDRAKDIIRAIQSTEDTNYKIIGCLEIDPAETGRMIIDGIKIIGHMGQYKSILLEKVVDEVIFAVPLDQVEDVNGQISFAEEVGVNIRIMPDWQLQRIMFRPETATIDFDNFLGIPTLSLSSTPKKDLELMVKGFIDYMGSVIGLILLAPIMIVIALAVKFTSPGPIFFSQIRSGLNGRKFKFYKFRSMVEDAEVLRDELEDLNEMDGPVFKIDNDPRITPVGRFIRKTSLDELPQLFNILKGDMSIVGPRPPIPSEVEKYLPNQRRRLSMKPGLTCIWQVSSRRNDIPFEQWMALDLKYIDTWSLMLDMKLIFRTFSVVFHGWGR